MLNVHKWRKKNSILKIEKSIQFDLHNVRLTKNGQKVIEITKEKDSQLESRLIIIIIIINDDKGEEARQFS